MIKKIVTYLLLFSFLHFVGCYSTDIVAPNQYKKYIEKGEIPSEILVRLYNLKEYRFSPWSYIIKEDSLYGEGFELLQASPYKDSLNFKDVAHLWNQGSVIRSWLLELLESAFDKDPKLEGIKGYVEDSGEGRWTVHQAVESGVSATAIAHSLFKRFQSRNPDLSSDKILAALRNEFGGHDIQKK